MKIRILGNTIRLRVKMHETAAIRDNGMIEEVLAFGLADSDKLRFRVVNGKDAFLIEQNGMSVVITVPHLVIEAWANTEMVGFEELITTPKGSDIRVLIEKDFACLDGDRSEEPGSYENPMLEC
ncbi:MAG: hypothetical protein ABIQ11_05170 [Saprospiraceae bacterium]